MNEKTWKQKATTITVFSGCIISLIVLFGYLMSSAKAAREAVQHAEKIWEMPKYMPELRRDVRETKQILEFEFGKVENGVYIPNRRGDRPER